MKYHNIGICYSSFISSVVYGSQVEDLWNKQRLASSCMSLMLHTYCLLSDIQVFPTKEIYWGIYLQTIFDKFISYRKTYSHNIKIFQKKSQHSFNSHLGVPRNTTELTREEGSYGIDGERRKLRNWRGKEKAMELMGKEESYGIDGGRRKLL